MTLLLFSCERFSARLTPKACALNYSQREHTRRDCRGCPIGKAHSNGQTFGELLHEIGRKTRQCDTPGCNNQVLAILGSAIGIGRKHFCDACEAVKRAALRPPQHKGKRPRLRRAKPCKTPGCTRPLRMRTGNVQYCDECGAARNRYRKGGAR